MPDPEPTHCKGCGAHLGTPPNGYGHILGCGYREDPETVPEIGRTVRCDKKDKWADKDIEKLLDDALKVARKAGPNFNGRDLAKALNSVKWT